MGYVIAIISGYLISSFVEYMLHKLYLHKNYNTDHIIKHHRDFLGTSSYENKKAKVEDVKSSNPYILVNFLLYLPISIIFFVLDVKFGIVYLITGAFYTIWVEVVHLHFHRPTNTFIENIKYYKYIRNQHLIHHTVYVENFGIGSSLWDKILRTYKK